MIKRPRIALVSMPFVSALHPSIQIGLLTSIARSRGYAAAGYHFNLDFAQLIGPRLFEALCEVRERRDCEWLFSKEAFGTASPDPNGAYVETFQAGLREVLEPLGKRISDLVAIRDTVVPAYIDYLMELLPWHEIDVVGFTSTFQQNVASFALARRIKSLHPRVVTLFGGSNFEAEMGLELVRTVDVIDFAVIGEADEVFPAFLNAIAESRDPGVIPGIASRRGDNTVQFTPQTPFTRLDENPVPSYDDYFSQALHHGTLSKDEQRSVAIPFESSRGCWWGEKSHCIFCGLNGNMMKFRAKTPSKLLLELSELAKKYGSFHFVAVDNILPTNYFSDVFEEAVTEGLDFEFFYEIKSNLSKEKLRTLRRGGVRWLQPGIESLHSHMLSLMRKGVSGIQNVNTLRWCRHYGISVAWNLLWGFPGEKREDYIEQSELMKRLTHLQPPAGFGPIWMERFSPIFTDAHSFERKTFRPESSYTYVYPKNVDLTQVAYFFEYEFSHRLSESAYEETTAVVHQWQERWKGANKPFLTYRTANDFVQIIDDREGQSSVVELQGLPARIYSACSSEARTAAHLKQMLELSEPAERIADELQALVDHGLTMREGNRFLSLALPSSSWR